MIVAFSTSSAWASTALFKASGDLIGADRRLAHHQAGGACLEMLEGLLAATGRSLDEATLFAADLGPGSFTGVRVGVALAKSLAYATGASTAGADAFDLVDPEATVVFPSKRGEFFVRAPGLPAERVVELPEGSFVGFGFGAEDVWPDASRFGPLVPGLPVVSPFELLPRYLIEPSISLPKRPMRPGSVAPA